MTAEEALTSLIQTLDQIRGLIPAEKASWDGDLVLRLAIERLWITAGNCAEEYLGMAWTRGSGVGEITLIGGAFSCCAAIDSHRR